MEAIEKPPAGFGTPLKAFEAALKHEKHVTSLINKLVDLARSESDHATDAFLQWFVTEQVEEEANAAKIVDDLKMVGDAPHGLFMLDKQLGARGGPSGEED